MTAIIRWGVPPRGGTTSTAGEGLWFLYGFPDPGTGV